jgi:malonyl CoA-acyl carrier protein transacylase
VSAVFSLKTGLAGRSYRGRLYIGGFSEQQTDGNFLLSSVLNALRDGLISVIDGINNANRQVVVVSRYNERQARQTAVTTPVQSVQVRTFRLASQRKRLP